MLARLNQVPGVQGSYSNGSGTLLLLDLGPGADPEAVTRESRRVLTEQVADRVPVPLGGGSAPAAVRWEQWHDAGQAAQSAETPTLPSGAGVVGTTLRRGMAVLAALLVAGAAVGLVVVWWLRRRGRVSVDSP